MAKALLSPLYFLHWLFKLLNQFLLPYFSFFPFFFDKLQKFLCIKLLLLASYKTRRIVPVAFKVAYIGNLIGFRLLFSQ